MAIANIEIADVQNIQCTLDNPDPSKIYFCDLGPNFYSLEVSKLH